ncbi:MAG: FG-GAP repeat domain-containing protein [Nannocystaceae bacterium]|nr:VCBS repeat-containing protein [bacterium]
MPRSFAALALLCPLLVVACGGDDSSAQGQSEAGGSSGAATTTGEGSGATGESSGTTDEPGDPDTGTLPQDCVGQQGEGPCMVETVIPVPSTSLAFGDFDADGDVDMIARSEETGPGEADQIIVFTNVDGSFDLGTAFDYGTEPMANDRAVALSRPRAMGAPSLNARSAFMQGTYGALGNIEVDAWWVQGGAIERFYEPTQTPPAGPWFGDFDGDGSADLAFAPDASTLENLQIHACTGQDCGAAQDATVTGAPAGPWTIFGTDTTGDGLAELLVVRDAGRGLEVVVLSNDGTNFTASSTLALGTGLAPASAQLADVDADGRDDLILTSTGDATSNSYGSTLYVFNQDGRGGLQEGPVIEAGERITGYAFADFNADGVPDIGLRRTDLAVLNVGLGPGFDSGVSYEITAEPTGIVGQAIPSWPTELTDLDGNGSLDIVTISAQEGQESYAANILIAG